MNEQKYDASIGEAIDSLIKETDLSNVSASSTGFDELPFGYYKVAFSNIKVGLTRETQLPMVTITFEIQEDGYKLDETNPASINFERIGGVTKRLIFKNYVIKDPKGLKNFISDLKKVEDPVTGEPVIEDETFKHFDTIYDIIGVLIEGKITLWAHIREMTRKDGTKGSWTDLLSDSMAHECGLI